MAVVESAEAQGRLPRRLVIEKSWAAFPGLGRGLRVAHFRVFTPPGPKCMLAAWFVCASIGADVGSFSALPARWPPK